MTRAWWNCLFHFQTPVTVRWFSSSYTGHILSDSTISSQESGWNVLCPKIQVFWSSYLWENFKIMASRNVPRFLPESVYITICSGLVSCFPFSECNTLLDDVLGGQLVTTPIAKLDTVWYTQVEALNDWLWADLSALFMRELLSQWCQICSSCEIIGMNTVLVMYRI